MGCALCTRSQVDWATLLLSLFGSARVFVSICSTATPFEATNVRSAGQTTQISSFHLTGSVSFLADERSLLRLRNQTQIRQHRVESRRIFLSGILVGKGGRYDHVLSLLPVHRCRDPVFGCELHGIEHPQHLVEVSP